VLCLRYEIISKKQPDFISGIQTQHSNGPITYSRDLPQTCSLSRWVPVTCVALITRWVFVTSLATCTLHELKIWVHHMV